MELSKQLQRNFFESFPGFLSIRDSQHRFVYINDNFLDWLKEFTDVDPIGKTGPELSLVVPSNVASMLLSCHDESLRFLKFGEFAPKVLTFTGHEGEQFFEIIKFRQQVDDGVYIFTTGFEVTKLYESARLYKHKSLTCGLTGLKNKRALVELIEENSEFSGVVIAIDLDCFKRVNDENGHLAGDSVLNAFSQILVKNFRENDFVARVGGDEFIVICENVFSTTKVMHRIEKVGIEFKQLFCNDYPYFNWSWGCAQITGCLNEAIDNADKVMYSSKQRGKRDVGELCGIA